MMASTMMASSGKSLLRRPIGNGTSSCLLFRHAIAAFGTLPSSPPPSINTSSSSSSSTSSTSSSTAISSPSCSGMVMTNGFLLKQQQRHQQQQQKYQQSSVVSFSTTDGSDSAEPTKKEKKKKEKKSSADKEKEKNAALNWHATKKEMKEARKVAFFEKLARIEARKTRRPPKGTGGRGIRMEKFKEWFVPVKVHDEVHMRRARQAGLPWQLHVACIVERLPVIMPDKEQWEEDYENLTTYLDQYQKHYPKGLYQKKKREDEDEEEEEVWLVTDDEVLGRAMKRWPRGFQLAPRETEADHSGEVRTTNRRLKTYLYLAVYNEKAKLWQFPTVRLPDDDTETLLEGAKRAVDETVGSHYLESSNSTLEYWCPSHAPWSARLAIFDEEQQKAEGYYGTKTFFVKIQYDEGDTNLEALNKSNGITDYAWLTRDEMAERATEHEGEGAGKFYHYTLII